jgi:hypothetical protein
MVCTYKQDELLYLNDDGDQHQQLLEAEHTKHIYICAKESLEADKQETMVATRHWNIFFL